jgi:Uma2 family endonuclease
MEKRAFTYADYKAWPLAPGERFELIEGVAYAMSAPNDRHQAIAAALTALFFNFLKGKPCKVRPAPYDVRLFYEEDETDDTVIQPDLTIVCDEEKRGSEGCRGAPDMIIEILSPSNTAFEMQRKLELYRRAGVREYWIIDPEENNIYAYRLKDGQFVTQSYDIQDTAACAVLPGLEIPLETVFAE